MKTHSTLFASRREVGLSHTLALFFALGAAASGLAVLSTDAAAAVGNVTQLSGTLSVKKPDGSVRILSQKSEIASGDTLNTQTDSFAQIKFEDGGQITLKPNTSVKIDNFEFEQQAPAKDSFFFSLVKGGLRAVTGLVGKRGDQNAYRLGTATATIGIRGTTFGVDDCTSGGGGDSGCGKLESAVYVSVSDGEIVASNDGGSVNFLAGQFGAIDSRDRRPRFLSTDPGLQFTPPASFIQSLNVGSSVNSGRALECVVRK